MDVHWSTSAQIMGANPPPRPAIPPKPDKDKIRSHAGTQASFGRSNSISTSTSEHGFPENLHFVRSPQSGGVSPNREGDVQQSTSPISKSFSAVLSPPSTPGIDGNFNQVSPTSRKPALPPKPANASQLASPPRPQNKPPPLKIPSHSQSLPPTESVESAKCFNDNATTSIQSAPTNGAANGSVHSPPPFLRSKPPPASPRGLPLSPTRPSSSTFFSSPNAIQNLNSKNFPSTSNGLNQTPAGVTPPSKLAGIRVKSASLGRNVTFPSPSESGGGGIRSIFSRRPQTLAKFLPLDLHIGGSSRAPQSPSKPKPNSFNLNPFILQQKQQQAQMSQQQVQPILNFGKSIAFSPESPLPPPPPPRLKKKLSPVNSLGSPTSPSSPTSPIPISSLVPITPLPIPPPITPSPNNNNGLAAESAFEMMENGIPIYAEINKEKKWTERKLKEVKVKPVKEPSPDSALSPATQPSSEIISPSPNSNSSSHENNHINELLRNSQPRQEFPEEILLDERIIINNNNNNSEISATNVTVVDSWLGKYLNNNPPLSQTDLVRSATPTYQSAKTGHIYETIGDCTDGAGIKSSKCEKASDETKEDELGENKSFLFKLLLKPTGAETKVSTSEGKDDNFEMNPEEITENGAQVEVSEAGDHIPEENLSVAETSVDLAPEEKNVVEVTPPPPPPRLHQLNSQSDEKPVISSYLIPTVIQDIPETEKDSVEAPPACKELDENLSQKMTMEKPTDQLVELGTLESPAPSRTSSILRRRSWNCDRVDSPCPSESSSATSSNSYLPYYQRRLSDNKGKRDSLLSREDWVDEGDLSNGALADAESSDVQQKSSTEDVNVARAVSSTSSASKGFGARRSRFINSFFGSFGKGSSSSSGGGTGNRLRHGGGSGGKRKEKSQSTFFTSEVQSQPCEQPVSKWGRQVSDSVLSTTMISSPIVSHPISFDREGARTQKSQSVQFSPEVSQPQVIFHERTVSEDSFGATENPIMIPNQAVNPVLASPAQSGGLPNLEEADRRDDESVSSSESVSGSGSISGSISGYEDILAELSPKEKKSFYVAREILTSERTFVDVLNLLTVDFPKAVKTAEKYHGTLIISDRELDDTLGGLQTLKRVNEDLLFDLEDRISRWKENPKIADILVKKGPFLKLYATYIKNFQKNSSYLDTCCQKYLLFSATVKEFEASERCQKLGLKHYMLKPVQRMPQYRLLLEDYLKSLEKDSEDYEDTVKGIAIVKDVAEHANEAIRLQVNAEKLLHLQNRLSTGTIILKSDRQLTREGELDKVCRKELQPRFFALMNDCLLCFMYHAPTGSPKDLKLRYELPLAGMRVSLPPNEDYRNEFSVISVARSFNLVAKSAREREEWMRDLNNAINDNIKKRTCSTPDQERGFQLGKEAPVWTQDSRVTMCQLCTAEFTPLFRRHHCRACGKVVCGNCSGNQAPLQYAQNSSKRVCDSCYEYLLDEFDKLCCVSEPGKGRELNTTRERFKKVTTNVSKRATKIKRTVPARLEVNAISSGSRISGYLQWREKEKKSWKRRWFVLIDRVLYIYAASEDIVAIKSIPLLGWNVEKDIPEVGTKEPSDNDEQATFKLTHLGQQPIHFQADSCAASEKWMAAMAEAVVL